MCIFHGPVDDALPINISRTSTQLLWAVTTRIGQYKMKGNGYADINFKDRLYVETIDQKTIN